ncbi:hypothetical protein VULLAG_LOCUS3996 [Vulpes lagopus]
MSCTCYPLWDPLSGRVGARGRLFNCPWLSGEVTCHTYCPEPSPQRLSPVCFQQPPPRTAFGLLQCVLHSQRIPSSAQEPPILSPSQGLRAKSSPCLQASLPHLYRMTQLFNSECLPKRMNTFVHAETFCGNRQLEHMPFLLYVDFACPEAIFADGGAILDPPFTAECQPHHWRINAAGLERSLRIEVLTYSLVILMHIQDQAMVLCLRPVAPQF